jgi:hypothetical protein
MIITKAAHKVAEAQLNAFVLVSMKVSFFELSSQKGDRPGPEHHNIGN